MINRLNPFITENIYHIFNKTINYKVFKNIDFCHRFIDTMCYYRSSASTISFSKFKKIDFDGRANFENKINDGDSFIIEILAYCIMPNHFHLLIKQKIDGGIECFMSKSINSFTKQINILTKKVGPIMVPRFKSVLVNSDGQLKHVSRYIHLNPLSSKIVEKGDLDSYYYSSFRAYTQSFNDKLINKDTIMKLFNNDKEKYREFILQNADYQERLEHIKHTYKWR